MAAAACIAFSLVMFRSAPTAIAQEPPLVTAALLHPWWPSAADWMLSGDPSAKQKLLDKIDEFRAERDRFRDLALKSPDANVRAKSAGNAMEPWAQVCRGLRDIDSNAAVAEAHDWIAFIEAVPAINDSSPGRNDTWYHTAFDDLGAIHYAAGNFKDARAAFERSIELRIAYIDRASKQKAADMQAAFRLDGLVNHVTPLYWRMSRSCAAERDFRAAHHWLDLAADALRNLFVGIRVANGASLSAEVDEVSAFRALPTEFQNPPARRLSETEESNARTRYHGFVPNAPPVARLRAHLYYKALLAIDERDFPTAKLALQTARGLPYYSYADEDRLDFNEPIERARIAIASEQYTDALAAIAEADAHIGPVILEHDESSNKPPIGPARLVELYLLKGAARLSIDPDDTGGQRFLDRALQSASELSSSIPSDQRRTFLDQLKSWRDLLTMTSRADASRQISESVPTWDEYTPTRRLRRPHAKDNRTPGLDACAERSTGSIRFHLGISPHLPRCTNSCSLIFDFALDFGTLSFARVGGVGFRRGSIHFRRSSDEFGK